MCGGGGKDNSAEQAAQRERERRARISQGTASIDQALAPFNDEFFGTQQQAFLDNALPQLDDQFKQAQKDLIFALSRGGLLQSSTAAQRQRALNEERARFERQLNDQAVAFANQGRSNLETTRSNLISQLNATEDPALAASSAAREAGLLNTPPTFDPLGQFVFNAAEGLKELSNRTTGGAGFVSKPLSFGSSSRNSSSVTSV